MASPIAPSTLDAAVQAARSAGALVVEEFHRAGGPRGSDGHAHVDAEAEALIRDRLEAVNPAWGIRGEELQQRDRSASDGRHVWLIDPQDGTSAFLRGHRGTAVSIALLRDGVPVLGVVFACTAPDDEGDLLAWAEGCGPLTRNGQPVVRAPWAERLARAHTVLVSQDGDRTQHACRVNTELCSPARFRCVPGIAYRLALVAAGDAEAATSIGRPVGWDYAGGHALLRGVGGVLLDERGEPVRYDRAGNSSVRWCFGGGPGPSQALAGRSWERVHEKGESFAPSPFRLLRPAPGVAFRGTDQLRRAQGCLAGQLAGDALGSLVEFQEASSIARAHPDGVRAMADGGTFNTIAGQITDDSEMALMLARSIVEQGGFDREHVARSYSAWHDSAPFDMGNTTRNALGTVTAALARGGAAAEAAERAARELNMGSKANGALMRISPLAIHGWSADPLDLAEAARADASLTHPNPVCGDVNALFAVVVAQVIAEGLTSAEAYDRALHWAERLAVDEDVRQALHAAATAPPEDFHTQAGYVLVAFQNAWFQLLHAPTLEEGVVRTVSQGGDTDTNAAIAGALLGAVHGRDAVPRSWRDRVETCRPQQGLPDVLQPRPASFWPTDWALLAERLLLTPWRPARPSTPT